MYEILSNTIHMKTEPIPYDAIVVSQKAGIELANKLSVILNKTSNKIDPERYESYFNIGNIYYHLKNYEMAVENFHKATLYASAFHLSHGYGVNFSEARLFRGSFEFNCRFKNSNFFNH